MISQLPSMKRWFVRGATRTTRLVAIASVVLLAESMSAGSPGCFSVSVAPGSSPAGYLPLSLFGIPPVSGVLDDNVINFTVAAFNFGGESWTRVGFSSNGYVVIGGGSDVDNLDNSSVNQNFPDPTRPNNVLAPFWTNLNPAAAGALRIGTLTDGSDSWIVLDWEGVREFSTAGNLHSFQVWIGLNSDANPGEDISFAYGPNTGNGDLGFLTVGAENSDGTSGQTTYFNGTGTLPSNGTQLRVTTTPDQTAPTITLKATPIVLWPPNHKYTTLRVSDLVASVSDNCDKSLQVSDVVISRVSSDEAENAPGDDGATLNDIVIGDDCRSVHLRAERNGSSDGRVYTIELSLTDASGNVGTATARVSVPLNQSGAPAVLGPGPGYTVVGSCE
jgi:hypothetical protein